MSFSLVKNKELKGHDASIVCIKASPNKKSLLSGSEDGTCKLWDLESSTCLETFHVPALLDDDAEISVNSVVFHPESENIIYFTCDKQIFSFDSRDPGKVLSTFDFNKDEINEISINKSGTHLAACDDTGKVEIIDLLAQKSVLSYGRAHDIISTGVSFRFGKGRTECVSSGGVDCTVAVWDYCSGKPVETLDLASLGDGKETMGLNPPYVNSTTVSENGELIASALADLSIMLFKQTYQKIKTQKKAKARLKAKKLENQKQKLVGHTLGVSHSSFAANDTVLLSGGNDAKLCLWDLTENFEEFKPCFTIDHKYKVNWTETAENLAFVCDTTDCISLYDINKTEVIF